MSSPAGVVDDLLAGRYRLTSRLAAGGMGEVWRARDLLLDRDVAVKTLRAELSDDDDVRARFRAEARHAGGLNHPGIASVYDFSEDGDRAWLVLELVEGTSLAEVLRQEGRLSPERTLEVVAQTAAALQAAHAAGVVHRDVKPGNLLVRPDGAVKVTDFGIASAAGTSTLTRTGQVVGTAAYLAPEQADGRGASTATDLYALGVLTYECLSGVRPFDHDNPMAVLLAHLQSPPPPLPEDVPGPVAGLVMRLLAKDPAERPASAAQVAAEADALRLSLPGSADEVPAPHLVHSPPPTAPLPLVGPGPAELPPRPLRVPARDATGLSGRPGQRRAVRATALLLGLLAVGLGVRSSLEDASTRDPVPTVRPTGQPATPASTSDPADVPAVVPPPAPAGEPQEAPPPAPEDRAPAPEPEVQVPKPQEPAPAAPADDGDDSDDTGEGGGSDDGDSRGNGNSGGNGKSGGNGNDGGGNGNGNGKSNGKGNDS